MKRKFLKELGLNKQTIDQIMDENGRDCTRLSKERDFYKSTVAQCQEQVNCFIETERKMLTEQIKQLSADLEVKDRERKLLTDKIKYENELESLLSAFDVNNIPAVKILIEQEELQKSDQRESQLIEVLLNLRKLHPDLFNSVNF